MFESFTFLIAETPRGVVQVHAYPYSETMSTFIVETTDALPLDKAACEALFGYELVENRTRWINFVTVRNERWRDGNIGPARRRRAHGALLDRQRDQAGDGGRDLARLGGPRG